jgi:hypothetical protein
MSAMNARRATVLVAGIGLTLAACGTSEPAAETVPIATEAPTATAAPATDAPNDETPAETPADSETRAEVPATDDAPGAAPATDAAAAEPAPTDAVPAEPEPPTVGGRTFATTVEPDAQFDGNPFPDLVVDDVGRGGEANIANILPSDRPVLLWTWAPH